MHTLWTGHHHHPSTNGAPQVVAVGFMAMVVFMLLLPMAQVSFGGAASGHPLLFLLKTDTGFNLFALLLLLAPIVGVAEAMLAKSAWRVDSAVIALIALILVPLTLLRLNQELHHTIVSHSVSVSPDVGTYVLLIGYLILAIVTGTAALKAHHADHHNGLENNRPPSV